MCSQRGIVVVLRCDDDSSNISRVSAIHSSSFCCQNHLSLPLKRISSSLLCVWGITRMALHGSATTGRFAGCQIHTVGINSIWTVSLQKQLKLSLLETLFEQIFFTWELRSCVQLSVCRCKCRQDVVCSAGYSKWTFSCCRLSLLCLTGFQICGYEKRNSWGVGDPI